MIIWLTGLSGAGKTTIAETFIQKHPEFILLDGDTVRGGLNKDLGFTATERRENLRRVVEVCKLFKENQNIICAFITPYEYLRHDIKQQTECVMVHVKCDIGTCKKRDPKGLYKKAEAGEIRGFTGIDDPFEAVDCSDLIIDTSKSGVFESVKSLERFVLGKEYDTIYDEVDG